MEKCSACHLLSRFQVAELENEPLNNLLRKTTTLTIMYRRHFKCYIAVLFVAGFIAILIRNRSSFGAPSKTRSRNTGCVIPKVKLFDLQTRFIFRKRVEWKCPDELPSFIGVSSENVISIDRAILEKFYPRHNLSHCEYVPIVRGISAVPDDGIRYVTGSKVVFTDESAVSDEFIKINCRSRSGDIILSEFKAFIVGEPPKTQQKLNVLIVGVDSVSKMNFVRHFPRTLKLLQQLGSFSLDGYNKVELNTLVNVVPLLTGHRADSFINYSVPSFFDDVPFIWKQFSKAGYRTLFAEDGPKIGMFNYGNKGFVGNPTDHYFRPFSVAVDLATKNSKERIKCIGSKLESELVFDWVARFCRKFAQGPYFAMGYTSTLTHDGFNDAGYADYPLERFLRTVFGDGMNRTALFLISDHGLQFADDLIMDPYSWQLEERLPFAHIVMPEWYLKLRNGSVGANLLTNRRRLTSPFDIHETLLDILGEYSDSSFGISLFKEVPLERTCEQAGIPLHYCACHTYEPISLDDTHVQKTAESVIQYINRLTRPLRSKCESVELVDVENAEKRVSDSVSMLFFRVTVRTGPNDGLFESTVRYRADDGTYDVVDGGVNRVNRYANQSSCIQERKLFPFCFCLRN